ncbi:molybdopterin-dependent oxidoreductase [Palaeococcus ferrophilus]|uniref:molybdopterin-dependent oxidoreductase n=1 Tax=Palaeococcus ferrophilus TaxID=83868 RepID=UPI0006978AD1|nr:molybdopterin-dependent oxidoreductase [Palaeococcus ferrophilus]
MRKLLFAFILIALLAGAVHLGGRKNTSQPPGPEEGEPSIEVTGLVERPYNMTYDELMTLPSKNVTADLYCVDNPKRPRKNGTWAGVPLKVLIEKAGPTGGASKVALYASDGYTTDLYLASVMRDDDIIVAYSFNGEPISPRLVVPGRWGYKWIKYIHKNRARQLQLPRDVGERRLPRRCLHRGAR